MGKQWKQWLTLYFWAPKSLQMVIAAMKLKDAYSLEGNTLSSLDSILKSRDITLPTKVHLVRAIVFPVVMYGCESWTIKTGDHWRIDAFNTFSTWCEELTHWKRLWCWERLRAGGEGDDRGWDGWMASPTQQTWVWVDSRSWWWTGRPGMLQFMGSQRVRHDWATELNWYDLTCFYSELLSDKDCLFHFQTVSLALSQLNI